MPGKRSVVGFGRIATLALGTILFLSRALSAESWEIPPQIFDGPDGSTFQITASNRFRIELNNWWKAEPPQTSRYVFESNRFRLGIDAKWRWLEVFVDFQHSLLNDLPTGGPGPGNAYYANTPESFQQSPMLGQAWARAEYEGFSLKLGRMSYVGGLQAPVLNPTLDWIVENQIAQRLIGPFDFTATGRRFDGGQLQWQNENFNVNAFGFLPTWGGFEVDGNPNISEINLGGLSFTVRDSPKLPRTTGRVFYIAYADDRDIVVLDNRPLAEREADVGKALEIHTVGANVVHVEPLGPGLFDVMGWAVGQFGSWQGQRQLSWGVALELGYQLPDVWGSPWVRIGINSSSGDSDPSDGDHESFFQILPTARQYAQTPFYNLMNNTDVFVTWMMRFHERLRTQIDFHWLRVTESADYNYSGGGATSPTYFGYGGVPANGHNGLAFLLDIEVNFQVTKNLDIDIYYGHGFGQGVVTSNFLDRDLDYVLMEFVASF